MYAIGPAGMQNSRIWVASAMNQKRADSRAERRVGARLFWALAGLSAVPV
jgi:hypothetical protein